MKKEFTSSELAGLPGMPRTDRGVRMMMEARGAKKQRREKGKGWVYLGDFLPEETKSFLIAAELPATPITPTQKPNRADLTEKQRAIENARFLILREIDRLAEKSNRTTAIEQFVALADAADLPEPLLNAVRQANGKPSETRSISVRTLKRWFAERKTGQLAPAVRQATFHVPPWAPWVLKFYRKPQKPPLIRAYDRAIKAAPPEISFPSYSAVIRWMDKLGNVERQRGRLGPNELRTIKPFTRRTTDGLWPMDVVVPDGHCFDAEIRHPMHGRPFRPEVTAYIDVATRKIVGWSVGLAEATLTIHAAMRMMVLTHGVFCVHYSDNGEYKGKPFSDETLGIIARLGGSQDFRLPYNSQAGGVIERFNGSVLVSFAKQFDSYIGKDMDKDARRLMFKATRKTPELLPTMDDFIGGLSATIANYNDRPHRFFKDRKSPNQAWAEAIAQGWEPVMLHGDDLDDLLPQVLRRVQRCEISLPWGTYYSRDLQEWHGEDVRVAYDMIDGQTVYVRDLGGRLIAKASRSANARPYFPESYIEHARDKREQGRLQRLERHADEARAERKGYIEAIPDQPLPNDLWLTEKLNAKEKELTGEAKASRDNSCELTSDYAVHGAGDSYLLQRSSVLETQPKDTESANPERGTPEGRFRHWKWLESRLIDGDQLTEQEQRIHAFYPESAEFRALRQQEAWDDGGRSAHEEAA